MKYLLLLILLFPFAASAQIITTVAGNGILGYSGDGDSALKAKFHLPGKVVVDHKGNLYIADSWGHRVRRVDAVTKIITTIAGTGTPGYNGDNIPADSAQLNDPCGLALDSSGNLYIADIFNSRIRKIDANTGIISTYAGNGRIGFFGDGGLADTSTLKYPGYICFDNRNNLIISDGQNWRIRKVDAITHIITTIAGNGIFGYNGDGINADSAEIKWPEGIAYSKTNNGTLYIAERPSRLRSVDASGIIHTVAGTDTTGNNGDNIPADTAMFYGAPFDVVADALGNLYIAEFRGRVRKIDNAGIIHTLAGKLTFGYNGDNIPADSAELNETTGLALNDSDDILFIADVSNERIRSVCLTPKSCGDTTNLVSNLNVNNKITIYPNPAQSQLTITSNNKIQTITITNTIGQVVYTNTLNNNKAEINIQNLQPGLYFISVNNNWVQKILKE